MTSIAPPLELELSPGASLREGARVYGTFLRIAFLKMLAYRLRYFTGIITYVLFVSVHYFIWNAIFDGRAPGERINGFTLPEMITYLAVGWISRSFYFSTIDEEIDDMVRSGQMGVFLTRPVSFHLMLLAQAAGESLFRVCFFTAPIALAILILFPVSPPASLSSGMYFLGSSMLSFLILAEINFLVGLLSFSLKSIQGIARAKYMLIQLLSGLLMPLAFFPGWFRSVVELLPFQLITYVPLQLYLGKLEGSAVISAFIEQLGWCVALVFLSELFLGRALRRLTIQGG